MQHFLVSLVVIERYDWNTIINLECETIDTVVHDDHVLQVSVAEDSEIFDIVTFRCEIAMLSVESVLDVLVVGVNVIQDGICVYLMTGGKDDDLEVLVCLFETLHDIWSDVDARIDGLFVGEVDLEDDIRVLSFNVINAVNQSLVHVEDDQLLLASVFGRR